MAVFIRGTGDPRTPEEHCRNIFRQYLLAFAWRSLSGKKDSGMPIIIDGETLKGKGHGDTATYHFTPQNTGGGIIGQNKSITGNEDSLDEFMDKLCIEQVAKAFAKKGKLTDLRTIIKWRDDAQKQLVNWFADKSTIWILDALTGYLSNGLEYVADLKGTPLVNGVGRCVRSSGANSFAMAAPADTTDNALVAAMATTDKMNSYLLDELSIIAKHGNSKYPIAPVKMSSNGNEMYILLLSEQSARDLRQDTRFDKRVTALINSGLDPSKDIVASGALGVWNNIILKECSYIRQIADSDTAPTKKFARNLLLGANAAVLAFAQTMDYSEEQRDHGRITSFAADEIRGQKKLVLDGVDQGVMQVVTASL